MTDKAKFKTELTPEVAARLGKSRDTGIPMSGQVARIAELEDEAETLRMQLAACGAVALSNTKESAEQQRTMHEKYKSASLSDVINLVDSEMLLRAQLEVAAKALGVIVESNEISIRDEPKRYTLAGTRALAALNKIQELSK